ncbi:hypothetical protein BAE44_0007896 [Dichanthelium oligosanthes]|uniref:DC1 domain-containing protein n=1 Tax=Dichanthelium oligosanthes TaxID=888268 RepID=A0A1E5W164_9POAL|nr:hypothetical protein BAE44_0007896 [Dichanthelium oligosanthes]
MLFKERTAARRPTRAASAGTRSPGSSATAATPASSTYVHDTCADNFGQSISFFAHEHTLRLRRVLSGPARSHCDLCTEECTPGSFAYHCARCLFDVHPHCTTLPETLPIIH